MRCATPVIASNVSSLPEIGADAALYINPYDEENIAQSMQKLTESQELKQLLKEKGLKRSKEFSWRKMAEEILKIYEGLQN